MIYRVSVSYSDGGKTAAPPERMLSYGRHTVGNRYGGKAATTRESTLPYARHTVWYRD